ncbi:hypothetical protein HPP92_020297 [Vanilla planifolia]|uniref:Uncharacterized protein n=1 Tax=Vanilla planifolia TaxID=51239 RepID=A0A835Q0F6_VANPL|nr:hypothetical protein HPP92_020297 [Vanilla planifolia]
MAEVSRKGDTASNVFYVTDTAGRPANVKTIDAVIEKIGAGNVRVCEDPIQATGRNRPGWGEDLSAGGYLSSLVDRYVFRFLGQLCAKHKITLD